MGTIAGPGADAAFGLAAPTPNRGPLESRRATKPRSDG
jgi:hypothetical protein